MSTDNEQYRAGFEAWWEAHGQFCRAGGGDYEKTFAYAAWMHQAMISAAPEVAQPTAQGELPTLPRPAKHGDIPKPWAYFTADQMQQWGASQRQEGRREGIEEAAALFDTSPHAEEFRCNIAESIRAIATSTPTAGEPSAETLALALFAAEAALADIGDADREPGDDVAWCEARAAEALPEVRAAIAHIKATQGGKGESS